MLEVLITDQVARVTLDRPEVHNAFNDALVARMTATFEHLGRRDDVGVIVLGGNGKSFSAGGDLAWMRRVADFTEEENLRDARNMAAMFHSIAACPKPVVARVHGAALGGGAGLVAAADLAIAQESAVFGFPEVLLGIVPGVISPYVVGRIGSGRAREYCLTGERFPARTALSIGLVHAVETDEAALDAAIRKKVAKLLKAGPNAVAETKWLLIEAAARAPEDAADYGARVMARVRASEEGRAGIRAFLENQRPPWQDRGRDEE